LNWYDQFTSPYNSFTFTLDPGGKPKSYLEITKVQQAADGLIMNIPLNLPFGTSGIKQIDFLTSLQKKFNLVIYPSKTVRNEFIVESFNRWYNTGRRWDFNKYVNLNDKLEVVPANNLAVNELNFGDVLDQDYISQQFSKEANREYGKTYYTDTENFFSQGKFEVKTSVASTQLLQITGTGLSGSVAGLALIPTQFFVGECRYGFSYDPTYTCSSPAVIFTYTTTGTLAPGLIVYRDQYGTQPITGLRFITSPSGGNIYELDDATGLIGAETGYNC
jgi:hypothetical protein